MTFFGVLFIISKHSYFLVITALLSAFGRAISEVGAVMIVGGNINHFTRVMTTAISLETRMGNLEYAMALGIVLILLTVLIYSLVYILNKRKIWQNLCCWGHSWSMVNWKFKYISRLLSYFGWHNIFCLTKERRLTN